jgi:predicted nuclease of restriction endonuclease-like (RecB) superfamily
MTTNLEPQDMYHKAVEIINLGRAHVIQSITKETTATYFKLGQLIVEYEQAGKTKAIYGQSTITHLSQYLTATYGRGYSASTLKDARQFFVTYKKSQSLPGQLSFALDFTHYVILMRLPDTERVFYEQLAIREQYRTRQLKRAIDSNTAYRVLTQNIPVHELGISPDQITPEEIIKNPYVAEFLGLEQFIEGDESKIEQALIDNLEQFLMELGKGFAFVG